MVVSAETAERMRARVAMMTVMMFFLKPFHWVVVFRSAGGGAECGISRGRCIYSIYK